MLASLVNWSYPEENQLATIIFHHRRFCLVGGSNPLLAPIQPLVQVRREVATKFKGLEIDTCPFANLPERKRTQWALTKEEMKNCVWLRPERSRRPDRVHRMDAGWSSETFKVCRDEGGQGGEKGYPRELKRGRPVRSRADNEAVKRIKRRTMWNRIVTG
jgi:hypothetical protein